MTCQILNTFLFSEYYEKWLVTVKQSIILTWKHHVLFSYLSTYKRVEIYYFIEYAIEVNYHLCVVFKKTKVILALYYNQKYKLRKPIQRYCKFLSNNGILYLYAS